MIYITITDHCSKQIKDRTNIPQENIILIFKTFIQKGEYQGRKVRIKYEKDGRYRTTDGVHQFIFSKPFKIEYTLITYVKRKVPLGKDLRRGERYINGEFGSGGFKIH